jgi:tetratricopeptide (TPR) repeat protein
VLAVVLTIIFMFRTVQENKREDATEKLAASLAVGQKPIQPPSDQGSAGSAAAGSANPDTFPSSAARAAAILAEVDHQGADTPSVFRGGLAASAGKYDEAIAELKKGANDPSFEGVLAREGLGLALEAKATAEKDPAAKQKGYEDALAAFVAEQPDENGPRRAYALYHQARMQALLQKTDQAKALFEKARDAAKNEQNLARAAIEMREPDAGQYLPDLIERRLAELGGA